MRMPSMSSRALRLATRSSISSVVTVSGGVMRSLIEAELGAGLHLAADVDLRRGHMAHQHRREPGPDALGGERATSSATSCLMAAAMAAPSRIFGIALPFIVSLWFRLTDSPHRLSGSWVQAQSS